MSRPKTPSIKYVGPSPDEIRREQEQSSTLLRQQEERFAQQYQQQQQQLQSAYENSVGILTSQMQQREEGQKALNQQLTTQLQLAQANFDQTKGLYEGLLTRQDIATREASALQGKSATQRSDAAANGTLKASSQLKTASARRGASSAARQSRGALAAYGTDIQLMGLLR